MGAPRSGFLVWSPSRLALLTSPRCPAAQLQFQGVNRWADSEREEHFQ